MLFLKSLNEINYNDVIAFCGKHSEGIRVEYKSTFNQNVKRKLPKVVSSFANSYGGILVIGVNTENGVPVRPFEGFEKPERDEIELTIENKCLSNIYPQLVPSVQVIDIPDSNNIFVVVEIPESSNAPHAIENTTKVYVRTGNQSTPYELAELERIETLIKKRNNSILLQDRIFDRFQLFKEEFHRNIGNPGTPNITVITRPLFMQRPISDLETTYLSGRKYQLNNDNHFNIANQLNRFQGGVYSRTFNRESNSYAFNLCGEFGEVIFHTSLQRKTSGITSSNLEETNRLYLLIPEFIWTAVYNLKFAEYFYNRCNYHGNAIIQIELDNVLNQHMMSESDPWRERGNLYATENNISSETEFSTENITDDIVAIISNAIYKLLWAVNQAFDSFSMVYIQNRVKHVLQINRIIP